jgi:hypothetical protein
VSFPLYSLRLLRRKEAKGTDEFRIKPRRKWKMPIKPSGTEEEYYARMEYERLRKSQEENQKKLATDQRAKEKELHYMKCPKCGMNLVEIDYKKIKVDKCSACEGIWLDAGELEMVVQMDKGSLDKLFSVFSRGD